MTSSQNWLSVCLLNEMLLLAITSCKLLANGLKKVTECLRNKILNVYSFIDVVLLPLSANRINNAERDGTFQMDNTNRMVQIRQD